MKLAGLSSVPWSNGTREARFIEAWQPQQHKVVGGMKEYFLHVAKPVPLWEELLFSFTLEDAKESLELTGSPSWWAHDTFNSQKLFLCAWADRQTDRIYLQGGNCFEAVTAAVRDWCGEVLGFHSFPRVCRGGIALCRYRRRSGQRNWVRNKPSVSIFCLVFQEASCFSQGLLLANIHSNEVIQFLSLSLCVLGV